MQQTKPILSEVKSNTARIVVFSDFFNKRIRIDDYSGDTQAVMELIAQSTPRWTEKLIIKARQPELPFFQSKGFSKEAFIKGYFNGTDMHFVVKYLTADRSYSHGQREEQQILERVFSEEIPSGVTDIQNVLVASRNDTDELATLYAAVFKVYPTPLRDADYLRKTMAEGTQYVIVREKNTIVSAASAEINRNYANAELTDCATLPRAQGRGYMKKLLVKLEDMLLNERIRCLYTIARSGSYGINKAFYQLGYTYGGKMMNNCIIYTGLENMNVWYKWIGA